MNKLNTLSHGLRTSLMYFFTSAIVGLLSLFVAQAASAATCTFASVGDSLWSTTGNWSCGHTPVSADDVIIPVSTSTNVDATFTINTLSVATTSAVSVNAGNALTVNTSSTNAGTISLGAGSGLVLTNNSGTTTNQGTLSIGSGTATSVTLITNFGTINGGTGVFAVSSTWTNSGTFSAGTGTVKFYGGTQGQPGNIPAALYYNVITENTVTTPTFYASTTILNDLTIRSSSFFNPGNGTTIVGSTNVSGTLNVGGGSVTGNATSVGAFRNDGTVTFFGNAGTLTLQGTVTSTGSLGLSGGVSTQTVKYSGASPQFVMPGIYPNLLLQTTGAASTTASTTAVGTTTVATGTTFYIGTNNYTAASLLTNAGTFTLTSGAATTTNGIVNSGTINGGTGTLSVDVTWSNPGTFNAGTGLVKIIGTGSLSLPGALYYNLTSASTAGAPLLTASSTVLNNFNILTGSYFSSSAGITSVGQFNVSGTLQVDAGGATSVASFANSGTITPSGVNAYLAFKGTATNTGTFTPTNVFYAGAGAQTVMPVVYRNLTINSGATASLLASTTAVGTFTNGSNTFAVGTNTFTVPSVFANNGTVTESGAGKVVHPLDFDIFLSSTGTTSTAYTASDSVQIRLKDSNRNLLGNTIETVTTTVSLSAGAGGDSIPLTLTETSANSGVFVNSYPFPSIGLATINTGDSNLQSSANTGNLLAFYADQQDTNDSSTTTINFDLTPASSSGSSGSSGSGGGGLSAGSGLGSNYLPAPAPTQTTTPTVSTPNTTSGSTQANNIAPGSFVDPSNLTNLLAIYNLTRQQTTEDLVAAQVRADAKEFHVAITDAQVKAIANFIVYGNSARSISLGRGERRALERDYFDTMRRADIAWDDMERIANGVIPVRRNLAQERLQVTANLPYFKAIFAVSAPNFQNAKHNLAWNTLMYRIRFVRDMTRESAGVQQFQQLFHRKPTSPQDWSAVRVLGYVK